jgi:hypothetical protein
MNATKQNKTLARFSMVCSRTHAYLTILSPLREARIQGVQEGVKGFVEPAVVQVAVEAALRRHMAR